MNHPCLLEMNTRVWLHELGRGLGRTVTFDDVPDAWIEQTAAAGYTWVWLLGVWRTGPKAREVSLTDASLRDQIDATLSGATDEDITGSPFAVQEYRVRREWGGDEALGRLRTRLRERGIRLVLDFVVNHMGLDHRWADEHPEYLIRGTQEDLEREPDNWVELPSEGGRAVFAYGRDPYFAGWPDTLQLNYRHAGLRQAMKDVLLRLASMCDGLRCDMAMLVQPDVIQRTWGERARPGDGSEPVDAPFWPEAVSAVREKRSDFLFMAEVYWEREWELQQEGFDYTYDKKLYDRLLSRDGAAVRSHLLADPAYQNRSVRFLENHDEPRAAEDFAPDVHRAAAAIAFLVPGMRFFHEGEREGRKVKVSMHVGRRPDEPVDDAIASFYDRLLALLRISTVHEGAWRLCECRPAWEGNPSHASFVAFTWADDERRFLVAVNYAPHAGQCYVALGLDGLDGHRFVLEDHLSDARYERDGSDLAARGLYLDLPAWGHHVFELRRWAHGR